MSPESALRFLRTAREAADQVAVIAREGVFCYSDLLSESARVANYLLGGRDPPRARRDLEEARVVFLVPPGFEYAAVQWGIWRAGGVAVPLALAHPPAELASLIADADPEAILVHASLEAKARPAAEAHGIPVGLVSQALAAPVPVSSPLPSLDESRRAQIIYTSGTTGKPKGAVTTHANTRAQVESLARAWRITAADRVLNALPCITCTASSTRSPARSRAARGSKSSPASMPAKSGTASPPGASMCSWACRPCTCA